LRVNCVYVSADRTEEFLVVATFHAIRATWRVTVRHSHSDETIAKFDAVA
jgi:hypothetical protein